MTPMKRPWVPVVGVTALLLSANTLAAPRSVTSTAAASLGPLVVTLVDLDSSDGITPWLNFVPSLAGRDTGAFVIVNTVPPGPRNAEFNHGASPWEPVSAQRSLVPGGVTSHAEASVAGATDMHGNGAVMAASGAADTALGKGARYHAGAQAGGEFWLSPNTQALFSAQGSTAVETVLVPGESFAYGYAGVSFSVFDAALNQLLFDGFSSTTPNFGEPGAFSDARELQLALSNTGDMATKGSFLSTVDARGKLFIPEPGSVSLMLLGLGFVLAVKHRATYRARHGKSTRAAEVPA